MNSAFSQAAPGTMRRWMAQAPAKPSANEAAVELAASQRLVQAASR
ncbi:hypothetical protein [Achromobacter sp. AONIH1]|nr:hypothetical protein [Achromobacter sp. AONIH1]